MIRNRFLGGISFLPLFAAETGGGAAGGDGKQAEMQLDPAEIAQHGDPDWEANDPGDIGTVAKEGSEDDQPEIDTGKKPEPEPVKAEEEADPEPEKAAEGDADDDAPKTPEELAAALAQSQKALKAISSRLAAKAADNRRLNEELQKTIKPVEKPAEGAAEGEGEQPVRADFKTKAEFDRAVEAEATRRASVQAFIEKCNAVEDKGSTAFGAKWNAAKANLGILDDEGRIPMDLLTTALETDDPAKVLYELGNDIDKATQFMAMTPLRRAIAMAKLAEPKAAPARRESKAPPPVEPIGGKGGGDDRPSDRDSDEEWNRKEEARERKLAEQRRARGY